MLALDHVDDETGSVKAAEDQAAPSPADPPARGPAEPAGPLELCEEPSAGARAPPPSPLAFLLVSHSLLGLIFARPDNALPIQLAGCCSGCCVCLSCGGARRLSARHRLLIFSFTLVATLSVTLETSLGLRTAWWAVGVTVLVVVPLTCWLKGALPAASERLNAWQPRRWRGRAPRVEEAAVAAWLAASVASAALRASPSEAAAVLQRFAAGWAAASASEALLLLALYGPCRCCCPCCLPRGYDGRWAPYDPALEEGAPGPPRV